MKPAGRGFVTIKFLLEDLSSGREGEFREGLSEFAVFQVPDNNKCQSCVFGGGIFCCTSESSVGPVCVAFNDA